MRPRQCRSLGPLLSYSARGFPEPARNLDRVKAGLPPPRALVTGAMHRTMMPATEWDRELIADLAAERVEIILAGNADEREQSIAASVDPAPAAVQGGHRQCRFQQRVGGSSRAAKAARPKGL